MENQEQEAVSALLPGQRPKIKGQINKCCFVTKKQAVTLDGSKAHGDLRHELLKCFDPRSHGLWVNQWNPLFDMKQIDL